MISEFPASGGFELHGFNMNKRRKRLLTGVIILILLFPLWMWLYWWLSPKRMIVAAIIDKTVLTQNSQEHASLTWVLNQERFTKTRRTPYKLSRDYFGFFPEANGKYRIKGLERLSSSQLEQLSRDCNLAYYADTYGVYYGDLKMGTTETGGSRMIYGGMSQNDIDFLKKMKDRGKLVIAEFNTIGSPTPAGVRSQFESLFGIRWTGWTGRYFDSFDTAVNKELPRWMVHNYMQQHHNRWPFSRRGIAFVNINSEIVVLEDSLHLSDPMPHIVSFSYGRQRLHLPEKIKYDYWFDVISITSPANHAVSAYTISVNPEGAKELAAHGIPSKFPAVIMHGGNDYLFYYFCGDFSDNPVHLFSSYFKGIHLLSWLAYNKANPMERKSFFWEFYRPMVTDILNNYYRKLHASAASSAR